jgi:choline dehydrogenase-like flavoprotein
MPTHECDICIIGGGISAALLAQKVSELRPGASIIVVEAGARLFDFENRMARRQRMLDYGENAWPGDAIADQAAEGIVSRTMAVGGSAMHWGGVTNRFSREDLRLKSLYGLATDWPLEWDDLEAHYCEAERRLGVAGEPSPLADDRMSQPYPMPPMPLSWNLLQLKAWAEKSDVPFWGTPQAKNTVPYDGRAVCQRCNTCEICPTGARYSPDFTFKQLLAANKIALHDGTLVRRLVPADTGGRAPRIASAEALQRRAGASAATTVEYRARTFVLASGYTWSPHLLLLSSSSRFPKGLANNSGLVGRYMNGHAFISAQIEMDADIYPGMNEQHSLISRQFFRCAKDQPYVRHDFRIWESAAGRQARLRTSDGKLLIGDALIADWRARATRGAARVRMYYDVHPDETSALTLSPTLKNRHGDPMPAITHVLDAATRARAAATEAHIRALYERLARNGNGTVLSVSKGEYLDHPAGGCCMGTDPARSVCDSYGRTHDHENLFVVGSPTLPTGGCTNGTLTFAALTLRSAATVANSIPRSS